MELTTDARPGGIERIAIVGRMDSAGTPDIDLRLAAAMNSRPALMVVDMAQVSFLASIGIRTLVSSAKALALRGGRMVIAGPQPLVHDVLRLAGIDRLIPVFADVAAACASMSAPAESV